MYIYIYIYIYITRKHSPTIKPQKYVKQIKTNICCYFSTSPGKPAPSHHSRNQSRKQSQLPVACTKKVPSCKSQKKKIVNCRKKHYHHCVRQITNFSANCIPHKCKHKLFTCRDAMTVFSRILRKSIPSTELIKSFNFLYRCHNVVSKCKKKQKILKVVGSSKRLSLPFYSLPPQRCINRGVIVILILKANVKDKRKENKKGTHGERPTKSNIKLNTKEQI